MAFVSQSYLEEIGVACDRRRPVPVLHAPNGPPAEAPKAQAAAAEAKPDPKAKAKAEPKAQEKSKKEDPKKDEKQSTKVDKKGGKQAAAPAASGAAPAGPFKEKSPEEIAKMSKEERGAYHKARIASQSSDKPKVELTKAQKREIQEAQRKVKDMALQSGDANEELVKELKLQGLTEDQAREVAAEMAKEAVEDGADEDSDDEEDLMASVRRWMKEQAEGKLPSDAIRDFNLKVRFQGHVDSTPPDHITCILHVLCETGCAGCDLSKPKASPGAIAKAVGPSIARYAPILEALYEKVDDVLLAGDVVVQGVRNGVAAVPGANADAREAAVIGCFMAIREIDMIEDEDLLTGCKRVEEPSVVLQKFVTFLEEAVASDDDESGSGED